MAVSVSPRTPRWARVSRVSEATLQLTFPDDGLVFSRIQGSSREIEFQSTFRLPTGSERRDWIRICVLNILKVFQLQSLLSRHIFAAISMIYSTKKVILSTPHGESMLEIWVCLLAIAPGLIADKYAAVLNGIYTIL